MVELKREEDVFQVVQMNPLTILPAPNAVV
jgi:hypothetical protein